MKLRLKRILIFIFGIFLLVMAYLFPPYFWKIESGPYAPAFDITYSFRYSTPCYPNKLIKTSTPSLNDFTLAIEVVMILGVTTLLLSVVTHKWRD